MPLPSTYPSTMSSEKMSPGNYFISGVTKSVMFEHLRTVQKLQFTT